MEVKSKARVGILTAIMIISILGSLAITSEKADAQNPIPVVNLEWNGPNEKEAEPTPSAQGSVSFSGTCTVDMFVSGERIVVTLTASVSTGWPAVVSPSQMVFMQDGSQEFSVAVVVPQATSATAIGQLTVDARGEGGGFIVTTNIQGIVTVKQYFRMTLESPKPFQEISPGTQTTYSVRVLNTGNAPDSFSLEVSNLESLNKKGWTVTLSTLTIEQLPPMEYQEITITIQPDRDWTIWTTESTLVSIKATSDMASIEGVVIEKEFPLFVYERGAYIPGFDVMFLIIAFAIGLVVIKKRRS